MSTAWPPAEPVTPQPVRPVGRTVLTQSWLDLAFVHWPVDPDRIAPLLPAGCRPDVLDGTSWLGLVPFRMHRIGLGPAPGLPGLGSFCETNIRVYSVDRQGRRGVVFLTLEAARLLPVLAGRWVFGLPYTWARMGLRREGDVVRYASRRLWPGPPAPVRRPRTRLAVRVGPPAEPGPLEHFLSARWGLHVTGWRGPQYRPNRHPAWPLHRAELLELDENLLAAHGFGDLAGRPPASVLWSPGVAVRFGPALPV